ncbi:hypothetical protein H9P43_008962 [Blastocladiella emersonii ATCC 22665]|nr:hypothetical protein H9P43_008962 [Blastocladiella emersonii ATCC 22665]
MDESRMIEGSKDIQVYNPERALATTDDMEVDIVQNFQQFSQYVYSSFQQDNTQNYDMQQYITQYEQNCYQQNNDLRTQIMVQYNSDPSVMAALDVIAGQFANSQVMQYQAYMALIEQSKNAQGLALETFANLAANIVDTLRAERNAFVRQIDAGNRALVSEIASGMSTALTNQQGLIGQLATGVQSAIQGQTESNAAVNKTLQDLGSKLDTMQPPAQPQVLDTSNLEQLIRQLADAPKNNSEGSSKKTEMLLEQILKQLGYKKPLDAKLFTEKTSAGSGLTAPQIKRHQKLPERPVKQMYNIVAIDNGFTRNNNNQPSPIPKHPFTMNVIGAKGQGKSTLIANLVCFPQFYKGRFDNIWVFNPTFHADDKYEYIASQAILRPPKKQHNVLDPQEHNPNQLKVKPLCIVTDPELFIPTLLKMRKDLTKTFEDQGKKALQDQLLIIDDVLGLKLLSHKTLTNFLCNSRHLKISCIIGVQRWCALPKTLRINCSYSVVYPIYDKTEVKTLHKEIGSQFSLKEFEVIIEQLFDTRSEGNTKQRFLGVNNQNSPKYRLVDSFSEWIIKD